MGSLDRTRLAAQSESATTVVAKGPNRRASSDTGIDCATSPRGPPLGILDLASALHKAALPAHACTAVSNGIPKWRSLLSPARDRIRLTGRAVRKESRHQEAHAAGTQRHGRIIPLPEDAQASGDFLVESDELRIFRDLAPTTCGLNRIGPWLHRRRLRTPVIVKPDDRLASDQALDPIQRRPEEFIDIEVKPQKTQRARQVHRSRLPRVPANRHDRQKSRPFPKLRLRRFVITVVAGARPASRMSLRKSIKRIKGKDDLVLPQRLHITGKLQRHGAAIAAHLRYVARY